ncbi:hypothetical protein EI77_04333 [Prosthecobacter fusiformis]|uniref:Uncharacterized protein n=1 Tax=Prosthecobacter fusiformis TaxID=48464 RepID=A0A4R7RJG1_9BACT|nr:hypothetical protein EI77_04333 [Prosthecobacter fusiformis]
MRVFSEKSNFLTENRSFYWPVRIALWSEKGGFLVSTVGDQGLHSLTQHGNRGHFLAPDGKFATGCKTRAGICRGVIAF